MIESKLERLIRLSERQNHRCAFCGFPMWLPLLDVFVAGGGQIPAGPEWRKLCLAHEEVLLPIVPRHPSNVGEVYWTKAVMGRKATPDHVIPRVSGGHGRDENIVIACSVDNHVFKNRLSAEIAAAIIGRKVKAGTHPHQVYQRSGIWIINRGPLSQAYERAAQRAATLQAPGA